ncbi:MAG: hypothetical protein KDC28_07950 [Saprospiraceae bacterium]|nr:hypothetical protein [Saprospiraceae bacterium]MCB9320120.1 hypothetical protein [Lewinellaceae bacterium]
MYNTSTNPDKHLHIFLTTALLITFFLFFIDEGNFNLSWMSDGGNWFVFAIYIGLLFAVQLGLSWLLSQLIRFRSERIYLLVNGGIGILLAIVIACWIFR